jgi:FKBP-type peptidyl-prolyl cis-trans isomerase
MKIGLNRFGLLLSILPLATMLVWLVSCQKPLDSPVDKASSLVVTTLSTNQNTSTSSTTDTVQSGQVSQEPSLGQSPISPVGVNSTTTPLPTTAQTNMSAKRALVEELGRPMTLEQRFSYTYGYLLMQTAMRDINIIDPYYFARGALDFGLKKDPYVARSAMNDVLFEYQDRLISQAAQQLAQLSKKNLENAEGFLAANGAREGVVTTHSGLQYELVKAVEGPHPTATDTVKVNYRLTYLDGRVGDASEPGFPSVLSLPSLIPGFKEGLLLMTVGSEYRFYVHPALGYGQTGSLKIEPNTLLIFDVTLVDIVKK